MNGKVILTWINWNKPGNDGRQKGHLFLSISACLQMEGLLLQKHSRHQLGLGMGLGFLPNHHNNNNHQDALSRE
jgi:hypothetical protein